MQTCKELELEAENAQLRKELRNSEDRYNKRISVLHVLHSNLQDKNVSLYDTINQLKEELKNTKKLLKDLTQRNVEKKKKCEVRGRDPSPHGQHQQWTIR